MHSIKDTIKDISYRAIHIQLVDPGPHAPNPFAKAKPIHTLAGL